MSGRMVCCFLAVSSLAGSRAAVAADDRPAARSEAVCLTVREPVLIASFGRSAPLLAREIVRQAFLIAARDECGLLTRDAVLREEIPSAFDPRLPSFELFSNVTSNKKDFDIQYVLSRRTATGFEKLLDWTVPTDVDSPKMIPQLAEAAEGFSRGSFKDVLTKAGLAKTVRPARDFAGVPRNIEHQLWEWNEIAVFGALRRIHAEIRAKGESPELLAGLVIGYANLGTLSEYFYSPAHKAFSARALLYAERLVRQADDSPLPYWHRAYVRTLIGLHNLAADDIKTARKLQGKNHSLKLPFWTEVIEAFSQGKLTQMLAKATTHDSRRLARYLNLEAVLYSYKHDITVKAGQAVAEECPDCFRALDSLAGSQQIGIVRMTTFMSFNLLSKCLRDRLEEVDGCPPALVKRLKESKENKVATPFGGEADAKDLEDEVDRHVQTVADLKTETASGRDTGEPSLFVLGQMIEEIELKHLIRRLELESNLWGVPTDHTIASYRALTDHHRYAAYVDTFIDHNPDVDKTAETLFQKIDPAEVTWMESALCSWLYYRDANRGKLLLGQAGNHSDPVFRDQMNAMRQHVAGPPDDKRTHWYLENVWKTSSHLPISYAIQIDRNWKRAKFFAATVEKDFADDPLVMSSLTDRYIALKQFDDAERCAKQKIHSAPDYPAYWTLASIYKSKGDNDRWKETLEKSLDLPAMGLQQAEVRNTLAHYHMDRKEWKDAVVYADAAAESYSAWSMLTASECHEMLREWDKAERYIRAVAERYDGEQFDWMLWCYRTGHGDKDAADQCARKHFESLSESLNFDAREKIGIYYLLRKEPEKALVVFKANFQKSTWLYEAFQVALIADALGKADDRDAFFAKLSKADAATFPNEKVRAGIYQPLAEAMQKAIAAKSLKNFDFTFVDAIISAAPPEQEAACNLDYFVGVFLKNRGELQKCRKYLERAARSPFHGKYNHVLACEALRDMKIPVPVQPADQQAAKK